MIAANIVNLSSDPQGSAESALRILGYKVPNSSTATEMLISRVRKGISQNSVQVVANRLKIDSLELYRLIGVSHRSATRMAQDGRLLSATQSDRLARIARVVGMAEATFESREAAQRWLFSDVIALGERPIQLLDTDIGTEEIKNVLMRIEYGTYS